MTDEERIMCAVALATAAIILAGIAAKVLLAW